MIVVLGLKIVVVFVQSLCPAAVRSSVCTADGFVWIGDVLLITGWVYRIDIVTPWRGTETELEESP